MHVCDHRYHALWTFEGPTQVVNRLVRCPDPSCQSRGRTFSPEAELSISMPRWCIGWDGLCWIGERRFARPWAGPHQGLGLKDTHPSAVSDVGIQKYCCVYLKVVGGAQKAPRGPAAAHRGNAALA